MKYAILLLLLVACARPAGPSLVWADEAADIWLQAVRRDDPGGVWEMLSRASQEAWPDAESFAREGLPRVQAAYADFAWPGAAERQVLPARPGHALVALWRSDGRAAAFPVLWEDEDWKVEWRPDGPLSPDDLPAGALVWVDGTPGRLPMPRGRHRVAVLAPEEGGPSRAAAWTLDGGRDGPAGGGMPRPEGPAEKETP